MDRRGNKRATELSGLREIRTMGSSKKKSIPRVQSSPYLDLYMLRKEKDRMEKEIYVLEKRKRSIQKRVNDINMEMGKLEEAEARRGNIKRVKRPLEKEWKSMALNY